MRRPLVIHQTPRRHDVGEARDHVVRYVAMDIAVFRATIALVFRPQPMHDETITARTVAFGRSRRIKAKCRRPRQRQQVIVEVAGARVGIPLVMTREGIRGAQDRHGDDRHGREREGRAADARSPTAESRQVGMRCGIDHGLTLACCPERDCFAATLLGLARARLARRATAGAAPRRRRRTRLVVGREFESAAANGFGPNAFLTES